MPKYHCFSTLLYSILKGEENPHSVASVTESLTVEGETFSDKTVDAWTRSERPLPADALAPLFELTGDIRILNWLPGQFGYQVVKLLEGEGLGKLELLECLGSAAALLAALASDPGEPVANHKLSKVLDELVAGLVALRKKVRG